MDGDALTWSPSWRLAQEIAAGRLTSAALIKHVLARIERLDPIVHAYLTLDAEGALVQAEAADAGVKAGAELGPLHGVPIAIKDTITTKGLRTTQGSRLYLDRVPRHDDIAVERLRAAGAVIIGKTNTSEFAVSSRTKNLIAGETFNPWDQTRISGASSGGSGAAVALGMPAIALGTDGGGSTRLPAALNGVFGLHLSAGRVPEARMSDPFTATTGPMTRDVRDAALILQVIAGPDPRVPSSLQSPPQDYLAALGQPMTGWRLGFTPDWGHIPIVDERVVEMTRQAALAFAAAGARVEEPYLQLDAGVFDSWATWRGVRDVQSEKLLALPPEKRALLSPAMDQFFAQAKRPSLSDAVDAEAERNATLAYFDSLFARYDLLCAPVTSMVAPPVREGFETAYTHPFYGARYGVPYTFMANYLGFPGASVPCGFIDGLPVGLQILAPVGREDKLLAAAAQFERMRPWAQFRPRIAN